jgi:hypothetical protein
MARVRSTAHPHDDVPVAEGECAIAERVVIDEGHESIGSAERTELAHASDAGSQGHAKGDSDEGSCTRSYYFGPSTITRSRIQEMIDQGYFTEGQSPIEMKLSYSKGFFTIGLRMPPHPVLADILLKFQVQLHQLTANAIAQLSNYVWAVASFGGVLSVNGFAKRYELHYHLKKMNVDGAKVQA